jgi:hypothetical protein
VVRLEQWMALCSSRATRHKRPEFTFECLVKPLPPAVSLSAGGLVEAPVEQRLEIIFEGAALSAEWRSAKRLGRRGNIHFYSATTGPTACSSARRSTQAIL